MTDRPELTRMLALHAEAADLTEIDAPRLTELIRQRRRVQRVATAMVPVVLLLAVGAVWMVAPGADRPGDGPAAGEGVVLGECGAKVTGSVRADARLTMSAEVPAQALDRAGNDFRVPVAVHNSGPPLRAVTATHPDITVVRNGVVVATPAAIRDAGTLVELQTGQSQTFDTPVNLTDCTHAEIIGPGEYQLYAAQRFDVQSTENSQGFVIEAQGGPWTIELR